MLKSLSESEAEARRLKAAEISAEDTLAAAQAQMAGLQAQLAAAQPEPQLPALHQMSEQEYSQLKADCHSAEHRAELASQQVCRESNLLQTYGAQLMQLK